MAVIDQVLLPKTVLCTDNVPRYAAYKNYVYDRKTNELTKWVYTDSCFRVTTSVADTLNKCEHLQSDHDLIRKAYTWFPYVAPTEVDQTIIEAGEVASEFCNRIAMFDAGSTVIKSLTGAIMVLLADLDDPVHHYALEDCLS